MKPAKKTRNKFKIFGRKRIKMAGILFVFMVCAVTAFAQQQNFTFMGDYDRSFGQGNGYFVDPLNPDPTVPEGQQTYFNAGGELLPDGSIIAGGRLYVYDYIFDFWLRKFTPAGLPDTSFGTNGYVRANFYTDNNGNSNELPSVLRVQPDGKIIIAGSCVIGSPQGVPNFGWDACMMRFNPNGSVDTGFGNSTVTTGNINSQTFNFQVGPGRVMIQTGNYENGTRAGTGYPIVNIQDLAIQPDGKIVAVGTTRDWAGPWVTDGHRDIGFIARFNSNGSLDTSFAGTGIARFVGQVINGNCPLAAGLTGVQIQPDGRIIAVGYDSVGRTGDCAQGTVFAVTRWSASGQLETVRDNFDAEASVFSRDSAVSALLSRNGNKVFVSGRNKGTPALVRLNTSDLSIDTSFGNGGVRQYNSGNQSLYLRAIQPDGKILGTDSFYGSSTGVVRFNPDGSSDQSFGNQSYNGSPGAGRLTIGAAFPNCGVQELQARQVLVRPNGRINLIGSVGCSQFTGPLAAVSQQNTTLQNGTYNDFENDGRTNISVFRSGNWFYLDSRDNSFKAVQFGSSADRIAPADYDGDGKTDPAVYRSGNWYILQSATNLFRGVGFGTAEDLPRPGDFDGDGRADIAVFRPSNGTWYWLESSTGAFRAVQFGSSTDVPLLADFDADGKTDVAVFRSGVWFWLNSSNGQFQGVQFGSAGDVPVAGDYDADSKFDFAVFRPSNGTWYRINSSNNSFAATQFGANGDKPVPGDYDNDGKNDLAVYRSGAWYILKSSDNSFTAVNFGLATDTPVPAAFLP